MLPTIKIAFYSYKYYMLYMAYPHLTPLWALLYIGSIMEL